MRCICVVIIQEVFLHYAQCTSNITLDYCNSLLVGVADGLLQRLQCAQDWAARTVLQLPRSVESPLHELHWLPLSSRIDYKLAVTALRAKHGLAPDYINELALSDSASRTLRSTGANLLQNRTLLKGIELL